ncbi:MAG: enoyl-ACP reductase [Acidobacteriota bacterium]
MYTLDLSGKTGVVFGVANHRSLAWAIAGQLHAAGARLGFTYAGERLREKVSSLAETMEGSFVVACDVTRDEEIAGVFRQAAGRFGRVDYVVHSVAFANREDLEGAFLDTSRAGFHLAMDISAYSLIRIAREAAPLMESEGGGIVALTYNASQRVVPSYNVMGSAKAALEHEVRQLAFELGPRKIRVNAISAGPVSTLSARGISGFTGMLQAAREKAPLGRGIEPSEVGKAALFLLSDMSSGITGEILYVDAGYNIMGI